MAMTGTQDEVATAARHLLKAFDDHEAAIDEMRTKAESLVDAGSGVSSWGQVIASEEPPVLVQCLAASVERLQAAGSFLRRAQARALHGEGMTMDQIADLFGVSRQRVSALLRRKTERSS